VPEEQPVTRQAETHERTIELGETRKGLDFLNVEPPKPATELIAQAADGAASTMPQASALPPPADDYAD
jgi:hypothetical protein